MMEVLDEREEVLEEGRETAAVTAVAMVVTCERLNEGWDDKKILGSEDGEVFGEEEN